ncbi:hypothetical protein D3C81_253680 [compost metagenome]
MLRQEQRDRADAAVGVDDGFPAGQTGVFNRLAVQHFGLRRVHLIERTRGDGELHVADIVIDYVTAPENAGIIAEDNVRALGINVLADAYDIRKLLPDAADPGIPVRDVLAVRDENEHHFAGAERLLDDDMPQQAAAGLFIICGDAELPAEPLDDRHHDVVMLMLDEAGLHVDDAVAAARIEAADKAAFGDTDRHLSLVAVAPRLVHAERRPHEDATVRSGER